MIVCPPQEFGQSCRPHLGGTPLIWSRDPLPLIVRIWTNRGLSTYFGAGDVDYERFRRDLSQIDIFDDLLARALRRLSHRPLLSAYDEQQTLSWQITLVGPKGADVR